MPSFDEFLNAPPVSKRLSVEFALSLYRIGDVVDVRDPMLGAWFHGEVVDVKRLRPQRRSTLPPGSEEDAEPVKRPRHSLDSSLDSSSHGSFVRREERLSEVSWDDAFSYTVRLESGGATLGVTGRHLRPRAVKRIDAAKVAVGDQVMANYNVEDPEQRGLWFDAVVTSKRRSGGASRLQATIFQGPSLSPRKECRLRFTEELYVPDLPGTQRNARARGLRESNAQNSPDAEPRVCRRRPSEKRETLHFGHPPGVPVGKRWASRVQLSNALAHRPLTAAIDGKPSDGAYSLVLSGAALAEDSGQEAVFAAREARTGLAENAAAAGPLLSRLNLALARNCAAEVDAIKGADAGERWREGRAVRVVRTARGCKASKFAPQSGFRYDGLYKIVSYWPVPSVRAWHFRLRRDDPSPAPWTAVEKPPRTEDDNTPSTYTAEDSVPNTKNDAVPSTADAEQRLRRKRRCAASAELQMPPPSKRLLRA